MTSAFLSKLRKEQSLESTKLSLFYLLENRGKQFKIKLVVAKTQPNGKPEAPQPYSIQQAHLSNPPSFLQTEDIELLKGLQASHGGDYQTHHDTSLQWWKNLASCKRTLWQDSLCPLQQADNLPLNFHWKTSGNGVQHLSYDDSKAVLIEFAQPIYWCPKTHHWGEWKHDYSHEAITSYYHFKSNGVNYKSVEDFIETKGKGFQALGLPLPTALPVEKVDKQPKPQLLLDSTTSNDFIVPHVRYSHKKLSQQFSYAPHIAYSAQDTAAQLCDGERVYMIDRVPETEQGFLDELKQVLAPFEANLLHDMRFTLNNRQQWQLFMLETVPKLKADGWSVRVNHGFRYHFIEISKIEAVLGFEEDGWFDFALQIDADGESVDLLPLLVSAAKRYSLEQLQALPPEKDISFTLKDGRILLIAAKRVAIWFSVLVELEDKNPGATLRLQTNQLARLNALEDDEDLDWQDPDELRAVVQAAAKTPLPEKLTLPEDLKADLRPYQKLGVAWMQQRGQLAVGGILADDMGLGKTLQTLAHLLMEKERGALTLPVLIVAPRSVMGNWINEAKRFTPTLKCVLAHGSRRQEVWSSIHKYDVLVTSYHSVHFDQEFWQQQPLHTIVLDEAQMIKNPQAKITKALKQLTSRYKLCLTGTPMENHLGELWSLFDFTMPGLLDSEKKFRRYYRKPIENYGNEGRANALMQTIAPFMLRRKKQDVAKELPKKTESLVRLPLEDAQRDIYETLRLSAVKNLSTQLQEHQESQGRVMILNALMQLRQLCCDPALVKHEDYPEDVPSAKREYLLTMLEELIDEGRSILVFSQFTSMLDLIAEDLKARKIDHLMLTGKTRNRDALVEQFQNSEKMVFLISLKAGGTGLTLTRADTVIHYDPWWNSSAEQQATDRAYRIGQDKPVFVYKLIAENTIEEKIQMLQQKKLDLLDQVYKAAEGNSQQLTLDNNALMALFADD